MLCNASACVPRRRTTRTRVWRPLADLAEITDRLQASSPLRHLVGEMAVAPDLRPVGLLSLRAQSESKKFRDFGPTGAAGGTQCVYFI